MLPVWPHLSYQTNKFCKKDQNFAHFTLFCLKMPQLSRAFWLPSVCIAFRSSSVCLSGNGTAYQWERGNHNESGNLVCHCIINRNHSPGPGLSMKPTLLRGHVNGLPLRTIPNIAGATEFPTLASVPRMKKTPLLRQENSLAQRTPWKTISIWDGFCVMPTTLCLHKSQVPQAHRLVTEIL